MNIVTKAIVPLFISTLTIQAAFADMPKPKVLAHYATGNFLENLIVNAKDDVVFTSYFAKEIEIFSGGKASTFVKLDANPVNLVPNDDGYIVLAHGVDFMKGSQAMAGNNVLVWLDAAGKETKRVKLPDVVFGNGLVRTGTDGLLMADSALGQIWRVDLNTGAAAAWFKDDAIGVDPKNPQSLGVNGLRRDGNSILITSSAAKSVFRLPIDEQDKPSGPLALVVKADGADDLAVDGKGGFYLATHTEKVIHVDAKGVETTVLDTLVDGCTSAALSRDGKTLYVTSTGGLFEGKKEDVNLVAIDVAP
jgi:sugar lactone lactonase YvrE